MNLPRLDSGANAGHPTTMPKRSSKRKEDENEAASRMVQESLGEQKPEEPTPAKNPAAVALGRLGGLKGGKARAAKLSKAQRSAIAKKAAAKRWGDR